MPMSASDRRRSEIPQGTLRLRKSERRRQLLEHAKRLFAAHGYEAITAEQIATAAGVSETVLYRHFESKKALLLSLLRGLRETTLDRWRKAAAELGDPLAKLHAVAELCLDCGSEQGMELRLVHRALVETVDPDVAAELRAFYLDCESLLAQIIAEGQQAGVFRRTLEPRVGAWEVLRTAVGYTLTLPLGIPLYEEPDYLPRAIECLIHCLLKTDV
jgi:AcrR family transcriptional regulator